MKSLFSIITLALLMVLPAQGEGGDSLQIYVQAGDSCMQQYNTFEALKCYQRAYSIAETQDSVRFSMEGDIRMKLADCYYKRANYRETSELLKNLPEDSLSHDAFRQLAYSYQKQGDNDSFMYWAQQLVGRFPMDGEVVAGLTLAYAKANQPQRGIICGMKYCQRDSTNILVNRALADAWFMNRDFTAAGKLYDRLLEQGDSTFNTLYSAGMCCSQLDSLERAYKYLQLAFLISGMQHAGCAYRLGVVCVDTQRYPEGLNYLNLARELMRPDCRNTTKRPSAPGRSISPITPPPSPPISTSPMPTPTSSRTMNRPAPTTSSSSIVPPRWRTPRPNSPRWSPKPAR